MATAIDTWFRVISDSNCAGTPVSSASQARATVVDPGFLVSKHQVKAVVYMAITTKQQITRELARLRMEQMDGDPDQLLRRTEAAHHRINELLDLLDAEALGRFHVTHSQ